MQLTYITARGRWYDVSWKGVEERSGGIVTNIGIHFFDLLVWLFGPVQQDGGAPARAASARPARSSSQRADVHVVPVDRSARPAVRAAARAAKTTFRSITVDGEELEFSEGFTDLHTRVYEEVLAGRGFGIDEARPSIELTAQHPQTIASSRRRMRRASEGDAAVADVLRARVVVRRRGLQHRRRHEDLALLATS